LGGATAKDVLDLIGLVKKEVKGKWGIELAEETRFLG
jgi:UDP-N-acetylenolpyruvoylglucosamine reductase